MFYLYLGRITFLYHTSVAHILQALCGKCSRTTGIRYALWNILWPLEGAGYKYARTGSFEREKWSGATEIVMVQVYPGSPGKGSGILRRLKALGEHYHVELFPETPPRLIHIRDLK